MLFQYFQPERIQQYSYTNGCRSTAIKTIKFGIMPKILCLVVKCFQNNNSKQQSNIKINKELDIDKYKSVFLTSNAYRLKSYIVHESRHAHKGHYNTIRQDVSNQNIKITDDQFDLVPQSNFDGSNVYVLFYQLIETNAKQVSTLSTVEIKNNLKTNRFNKIIKDVQINSDNLSVQNEIKNLIFENIDILHLEGEKLTSCDIIEHSKTELFN